MTNMSRFALTILATVLCLSVLNDLTVLAAAAQDSLGADTLARLARVIAQLEAAQNASEINTNEKREMRQATIGEIEEQLKALEKDTAEYQQRLAKFETDKTPKATVSGRSSHVKKTSRQSMDVVSTGGFVYVRWGKKNCDKISDVSGQSAESSDDDGDYEEEQVVDKGDAKMLYEGSAVTGQPNGGGGAEMLCMPVTGLVFNTPLNGVQKKTSVIYGLEYNFADHPFTKENQGSMTFKDNDVPCAVCQVLARSHSIMIPNWSDCPAGWEKEYAGYLVTGDVGMNKGAYTCMDGAPESKDGGDKRKEGGQLTPVMAECGSGLPCQTGYVIDCVVCSM